MRRKTVKIPIYFGKLHLIQTDDFKSIEKKHGLNPIEDVGAFTFRSDKPQEYYFGTGHELDDSPRSYIGTYQDEDSFVWHVFKRIG